MTGPTFESARNTKEHESYYKCTLKGKLIQTLVLFQLCIRISISLFSDPCPKCGVRIPKAGIVIVTLNEAFYFYRTELGSTRSCSFMRYLAHFDLPSASRRVFRHLLIIIADYSPIEQKNA